MIELETVNYDRKTGERLSLEDLFEEPEQALVQFSRVSRVQLTAGGLSGDTMYEGTEPAEENFACFTLLPDGVRLYFGPYQVFGWSAGVQTVELTLDDLRPAKPRLQYWAE